MSRLLWLTIILLTIFAHAGCAPPVGSIGGRIRYDSLWAVPYRVNYDINDLLLRHEDFLVFVSFRGAAISVPVERVDIGIVEDPDFLPDVVIHVPSDESYLFTRAGRKLVVIYYNDMETRYSIEVTDPFEIDPDDPNGFGSGIGIFWWNDPRRP